MSKYTEQLEEIAAGMAKIRVGEVVEIQADKTRRAVIVEVPRRAGRVVLDIDTSRGPVRREVWVADVWPYSGS